MEILSKNTEIQKFEIKIPYEFYIIDQNANHTY